MMTIRIHTQGNSACLQSQKETTRKHEQTLINELQNQDTHAHFERLLPWQWLVISDL